jgi:hypothetical protein
MVTDLALERRRPTGLDMAIASWLGASAAVASALSGGPLGVFAWLLAVLNTALGAAWFRRWWRTRRSADHDE